MAKISPEQVVDIAFAVEEGDPTNWNEFNGTKRESLMLIATSIVEQFDKEQWSDEDRLILMSTLTKLVTENFILHTQLLKYKQKDV
jgi:hypothetical protein